MHATKAICANQDHYKILGVTSKTASKADIKKQYYKVRPTARSTVQRPGARHH